MQSFVMPFTVPSTTSNYSPYMLELYVKTVRKVAAIH